MAIRQSPPLIDYEDGAFELLHRPGCMTLGSSLAPALILPPEQRPAWLPSVYAIAAHLSGKRALPDADSEITRRGRWFEGAFQRALADHDIECTPANGYFLHPSFMREDGGPPLLAMMCIASPDLLKVGTSDPIECKTVSRRKREDWSDGPPLYPMLQMQWQLACQNKERGTIAALFLSDFEADLQIYPIERHERIIGAMESEADRLADILARGDLPEPDASPASYAALQDLVTVTKTTIQVPGSEAMERAAKWRQAQADKKAAEATIDAQKQWFAANANDAAIITLDDDTEIKRRQQTRKACSVKESTFFVWDVK